MKGLITVIVFIFIWQNVLLGQENWQVHELGEVDSLFLRLKVKEYACIADSNWIGFEFENKSGDTLQLDGYCSYAIDRIYNGWKGNLTQEVNFYPFGGSHSSKGKIGKRKITVFELLSNEGSTFLGFPENRTDTLLVKCSLRFTLPLTDGNKLKIEDYKFEFYWYYPNQKQIAGLKNRLKYYLRNKQQDNKSDYYFGTLLSSPVITNTIPAQEFLRGLDTYKDDMAFYGDYILRYLDQRYYNNKQVLRYFKKLIKFDKEGEATFPYDLFNEIPNISYHLLGKVLKYYRRILGNDHYDYGEQFDPIYWYAGSIEPKHGDKYAKKFLRPLLKHYPVLKAAPDTMSLETLQTYMFASSKENTILFPLDEKHKH